MVQAVTQPRGRLVAGRIGQFAHMNPAKFFGDILTCSWPVRNIGEVAASCRLKILNPNATGGVIATGALVSISPGGTPVTVTLVSPALVQGTHAVAGANNCVLQMLRSDNSLIAEHLFSLTMNLAPANLQVVGDPTIT
ncbi:MAG: hypothetical protein U1B30_15725 [Pseudomonadota bacterium]|nr:hypothetical protein [Pseudomonadota bacterium]